MENPDKIQFKGLEKPLNKYIDHTLLKPEAAHADFQRLVEEAVQYDFASVCVSPYMAFAAKESLVDYPDIKVCTVVGFPHGNIPAPLKLQEVEYFAKGGVDEIDFVLNYSLLKNGFYDETGSELAAIDGVCQKFNAVSKCIVETCYLTEEEKAFIYKVLVEYTNIDYIKTSTGFGAKGAQLVDVMNWNVKRQQEIERREGNLLDLNVSNKETNRRETLKIKAAGGIKDLDTAFRFITCGADRLGMSASVKVMEEYNARSKTFAEGEQTT
jgi:deoxyribose-phosphate aldolase